MDTSSFDKLGMSECKWFQLTGPSVAGNNSFVHSLRPASAMSYADDLNGFGQDAVANDVRPHRHEFSNVPSDDATAERQDFQIFNSPQQAIAQHRRSEWCILGAEESFYGG